MTAVPHTTFDVTNDDRGFIYFPKITECGGGQFFNLQ
jgi:hypothetical protein